MHGQYNKLDVTKALRLRYQGLSNSIIAKRLGVTTGAVYIAFRKYDVEHSMQENLRQVRRASCWV